MELEVSKSAELLTPVDAINHLIRKYGVHYSPRTFAKNRSISADGPMFVNVGRRIYYRADDLDRWIENRMKAYRTTAERSVAEFRAKAPKRSTDLKNDPTSRAPESPKQPASPIATKPTPVPVPVRSRDLDIFKLLAGQPG